MPRSILGFVFINAHSALVGATLTYAAPLRRRGYTVDIVNLAEPNAFQELARTLNRDDIAFCYAAQGVGSRLGNDKETIWKQRRIPFVSIHGDHPCYNIFNHFGDTNYIANLYLYQSFVDVSRKYIGTDQIVDLMPFQTYDLGPSPIPFRDRPIKLLYLKAGESVAECVEKLNGIPMPLRDGVWQQIERAQRDPNLQTCDLVQELFAQLKLDRKQEFNLFWGCAHWMDMYIRRKRAADFVDWLKMQDGAVIVGNNWDFIDRSNARAEFRPALDFSETAELYRQSRFICNTSPYGRDVLHERVGMGLMNESMVITDTNAWWDEDFGDVPALVRFQWGQPLDDQLQPVLNMPMNEAAERAPTGRAKSKALFNVFDMSEHILDCVKRIDPECMP